MKNNAKVKTAVCGAYGRSGYEVVKLIENERADAFELVAAVDKKDDAQFKSISEYEGALDVLIDFSHHSATNQITEYAVKNNVALVIATTAHTEEELATLKKASEKVPVFFAANLSMSLIALTDAAKRFTKILPNADIEIIEKHHNKKPDAPSGTALMMAKEIKDVRKNAVFVFGRSGESIRNKEDIGIHSLRVGNVLSDHEILMVTDSEIITLAHQTLDGKVFAEGALAAAAYAITQAPGFYGMKDMLFDLLK